MRDGAPCVAPIDDDRHAPLTFKEQALGRQIVKLGALEIGELQPSERRRHSFTYILNLPELRRAWSRPMPIGDAKDAIANTFRNWLDGTGLAGYFRELEKQRAGAGRDKAR